MSIYARQIIKLSGVLVMLLGITALGESKASALDPTQLPIVGSSLQRGLPIQPTLEPSLNLLEGGIQRNNVQVCLLTCDPLDLPFVRLGSPNAAQQLQPRSNFQVAPGNSAMGTNSVDPRSTSNTTTRGSQFPSQVLQHAPQILHLLQKR